MALALAFRAHRADQGYAYLIVIADWLSSGRRGAPELSRNSVRLIEHGSYEWTFE